MNKRKVVLLLSLPALLWAAEAAVLTQEAANAVWTLLAAVLVFFMQAGFAMVEAGFTRAKNAVNIMMKNLMDFSIGSLLYWAVGFGLMFGVSSGGFIGTSDFFLANATVGDSGEWAFTFFLFQTVFAATAATIVSGAMAERTKFTSYLIYSVFITGLIYPISGHWIWGSLFHDGKGWLEAMGFIDFAGSTVVHSVGGWCALAGAMVLGAREGKYSADGTPRPIAGHNIPLAALGVFILWMGWFGFNAGSTTTADLSIGRIAITTNLAAAAGALTAMITAWKMLGKPDASMALNGVLAGLVAITAGCANVSPLSAVIIGAVGGILVVLAVLFIDRKLKVDDPVGAVSVHAVNGVWGTLAVGLFAQNTYGGTDGLLFGGGAGLLGVQLLGAAVVAVWSFGGAFLLFSVIKATVGLRVTREEELRGLDIDEHGMEAYRGFQIFNSEQ